MTPSTSTTAGITPPTLGSLGVRTLINCRGTYTVLSGSRPLPEVARAMLAASGYYVKLDELMEAVGQRLAELTGAEFGYVACGCAAALAEIAAACVTEGDPEKMARLPDTRDMRDEIIMQRGHRNGYDRSVRMTGARVVEVVTRADLQAAINPRTAMILITSDQAHLGRIPVEETIAIGHARGVPCLVDAAAERPDAPNAYLQMGADAVAYSGGKCLRGPQSSGLVLGRRDLLWTAYLNGAPHHGLGRPMKADREAIMGLLAAVEAWMRRDHDAEWRAWEGYLATISEAVRDLPSLRTEIEQPGVANVSPKLIIRWDAPTLGHTSQAIHDALWAGPPAIAVHLLPEGIKVNPYMMEADEDRIVARRLRELMTAAPTYVAPAPPHPPAADLSGEWLVELRYALGGSTHALNLRQEGNALSGSYRTPYATADVTGDVDGDAVTLSVTLGYEANMTRYAFTGRVEAEGALSGEAVYGEYGSGTWSARRVSAKVVGDSVRAKPRLGASRGGSLGRKPGCGSRAHGAAP